MRVFLDANVLFSASNAGSHIAGLIAWLTERETAISSDLALEEARKNLVLKRAAWLPAFEDVIAGLEIVPSALFSVLSYHSISRSCPSTRLFHLEEEGNGVKGWSEK